MSHFTITIDEDCYCLYFDSLFIVSASTPADLIESITEFRDELNAFDLNKLCQNCLQEIPDNDKENDELPTCVICEAKGCSHCLSYCKTCSGDVCSNCECNHDNWGA